jgi:TetR/AcrR family tetracycline transcriptional repressor
VAATKEPKTGARRKKAPSPDVALSRELIISTALAQIDEEGLESFSLRTLAARIGVYPTAIYWYVPNRNELMAQVVALILENVEPSRRRRTWQQHLRDMFENFRAAVRAHPNVAPMIGTQLVSNTTMSFGFVESVLSALTRAGLTGPALVGAYNSVIAAMAGFIAQEFAPMPVENPTAWQMLVQQRLIAVDRDQHPTLAANLPLLSNHAFILRWQNGVEAPLDDSFAMFVDVVITGIEALAARP